MKGENANFPNFPMISAENHLQNPVDVENGPGDPRRISAQWDFRLWTYSQVQGQDEHCCAFREAGEYEEPPKKIPSSELTYPRQKALFEDDFPFSKVGYVKFLEGTHVFT